MTQQIINVGAAPNDGTGDPARSAFTKCNDNFTELYTLVRPTGQTIEYQFNNTTTEPPSTGQIRFNQATQASTTKLWASHTASSGINIKQFLAAATTGAKLVLQDKIDNTNYIKFDVTGAPVDKTTYWEFAVAVTASGGNLPNAAILAAVTAATGGGTSDPTPPQGRMTLQTATPVMTTTQSAKTTIFYTPYVGNQIPLYNGTSFAMTTFSELSVATTDTTQNAAAVGASQVLDWYVWLRSGVPVLSHGPAWTSDTSRTPATATPVMVNGVLLNAATIGNGTTTGPAAQRGTYVGTTRSNASSQLDWQLPVNGNPATPGLFNVWNVHNRVSVRSTHGSTLATQSYVSGTIRPYFNDTGLRVTFVSGLAEDAFQAITIAQAVTGAGGAVSVSIGYDSTTASSGLTAQSYCAAAGLIAPLTGMYNTIATGVHFFQMLQVSDAAVGGSFYGQQTPAQTGITFEGRM